MTAHLQGNERLLVRLPKWLGDCVMAEPALAALADYWRSKGSIERLTLIGHAHLLGLWDERFASKAEGGGANFEGANLVDAKDQAAVKSAMSKADVALLFTGSFRSAFEAWRAGIPRRIGWGRDVRGLLLTDTMRPMLERGAAPLVPVLALTKSAWMLPGKDRLPRLGIVGRFPRYAPRPFGSTCIELVASLGIPVRRARPQLRAAEQVTLRVHSLLREKGIDPGSGYVVLNAGSRPGSAKGWMGWRELIAQVRGKLTLVVVCGPGEQSTLESLLGSRGESESSGRVLVFADPILDLAELCALAEGCAAFVTADAGARHIATASGAKTLVLFGPTDARHTADHLGATTSFAHRVECGPCHKEACDAEQLLACFTGIPVDRVTGALLPSNPALDSQTPEEGASKPTGGIVG